MESQRQATPPSKHSCPTPHPPKELPGWLWQDGGGQAQLVLIMQGSCHEVGADGASPAAPPGPQYWRPLKPGEGRPHTDPRAHMGNGITLFFHFYNHIFISVPSALHASGRQAGRHPPALYIRMGAHAQSGLQIHPRPRRAGQEGAMSHHDRQSGRQDVRKIPCMP